MGDDATCTHLNVFHQVLLEVVVTGVDGIGDGAAREARVVLEYTVGATIFAFYTEPSFWPTLTS